jgi:TPR repeat protein
MVRSHILRGSMADLRSLSLLRNDPVEAEHLLRDAEKGDVDAQYAAGLIYAEGRGVEINEVLSFFWLTLAYEQGDKDAGLLRNIVGTNMSQQDYDRAVDLVRKHKSAGFQFGSTAPLQ